MSDSKTMRLLGELRLYCVDCFPDHPTNFFVRGICGKCGEIKTVFYVVNAEWKDWRGEATLSLLPEKQEKVEEK